jgi:signal transduction histidine kinase
MADEPDNLTLAILREIRSQIATMQTNMATKDDVNALGRVVAADLHDLNAKIDKTRTDLSGQIATLREAVTHYHSSVIGHGVIISELEARMRRVEQHLGLPIDN